MTNQNIRRLGASPETLIEQMHIALNEIIAKTHRLKYSEELEKILTQMKNLYFKLNMAKLTNDKTIISITGLQGVGKTKIVRDLYNLDDTLLPSDGGRGEALPVLFTETDGIKSLSYHVRRAFRAENGLYKLRDIEIDLSNFNAISRDPDKDDLWLEILLPRTHFNTDISLALLPGFEKDRKQLSQKYLETFLTLSTSVLLVFNHKNLAREDQQILIEKVASDYKDNAPVFALSFAEELDLEQKDNLKNDLCQKFNIPVEETDRIVFTGISDELKNFPKDILDAVHKYSLTNASGYKKQLRMLANLTGEIRTLSAAYENEVLSIKTDARIEQLKTNDNIGLYEIRDVFSDYRKKVTRDVRREISKTFSHHVNYCSDQMGNFLENETHTITDKFKAAFNKNIKFEEKRRFDRQLKNLWNGDNDVESERRLIKSLDSFVDNEIQTLEKSKDKGKTVVQVNPNPLLPQVVQSKANDTEMNHNEVVGTALANIHEYINPEGNDLSITLTRNDLKVMPIVAVGIAQEVVAASLILDHENFDTLDPIVKNDIQNQSNTLVTEFNNLAISTSTVVKGAAIFFGIDALDGTFNSFGALTGILTSLGVSSSAAGPIGLLAIGTIGSGLAVRKGAERIEKYKFEREQMALEMFKSISKTQEGSTIATINNILDKMEDKLIEAYHFRRGSDTNFGLLDELDNRLSRLQHLCGEMQELMFRNESYIH